MLHRFRPSLQGAVFAMLLLSLAPAATAEELRLPQLGAPGGEALPVHKERQLGSDIMAQLRRHLPLLEDPEIEQYINDLGQRLVAHSHAPDYDFYFFVVEDENINAFALPGGYIGIHRGLIRETTSESELAAVIAHEIAHVTERHIARQLAQAQRHTLQSAAAILAAIVIGAHDPQAGTAAAMAGMAAPLQEQLRYSREHELEADRTGLRNLAAANLDPHGMPSFFRRLAEASRYAEQPPEYLQTHPLTQRRITESQNLAQRLAGGEVIESGHHPFIRARLAVQSHERGRTSAVAHMDEQLRRARTPGERSGAIYGLALALAQEEQAYAQALALLDTLSAIDGERLFVLLARGEILRAAERPETALEAYAQARALYPDSRAALQRQAQTLLHLDRAEEARRLLTHFGRSDDPSLAPLLRLYAEAAHASGREAEGYIAYARFHYLRGDTRLALAQLDNAIRYADDNRYRRAQAEALRERWQQEHSAR
ncbi:hypothetical protein CKO15_02265 [Halorhodospira abdelmalekii]|uniref:M48 family metalloprotease n=1 Tax=Halorhodospira abdelmalekii TaxID=421629 RepID=UPI00190727B5|nr:M48 family metalloprotease [Halorhodospira abdelmalekii]MBK1734124.1 hypothetical protein [Halorhodospira abdelmalekii]